MALFSALNSSIPGGLHLSFGVHVQFQEGYVLKFYILLFLLIIGVYACMGVPNMHGGFLGDFDSRGSFLGSFRLMRKSPMMYDPLGKIFFS